jgi:hypothetical protein
MQGNCTGAPPPVSSPPLLKLKPGQCVLLVDEVPIDVLEQGHKLLLSNLYLRFAKVPEDPDINRLLGIFADGAHVWLDKVTFQGKLWQGQSGYWTGVLAVGEGVRLYASGTAWYLVRAVI